MFKLGTKSRNNLQGVKEALIKLVEEAITTTRIDFTVIEGVRSQTRQQQLVKAGASQTLQSKHLTGDAVDLAAWVAGKLEWNEQCYYPIADAMRDAAVKYNVRIRWGGAWGLCLNDFPDARSATAQYKANRKELAKRQGKKSTYFFDFVHFELL